MAEIEFTAKCSECGRVLDVTTDIRAGNLFIDVTACEHCIDSAKNEADKDGFSRGFDDGSDQGHKEGFEEGGSLTEKRFSFWWLGILLLED